jgi:hypothetical protein
MLIMKHASPGTFLNYYHPLQIDTDMIRIIEPLPTRDDLQLAPFVDESSSVGVAYLANGFAG